MARPHPVPALLFAASILLVHGSRIEADSSLTLRIPELNDPADPILVYLDLASDRDRVAAVGFRLTYNAAKVTLIDLEKGADVPPSWSFVFRETVVRGQIDAVLTDQTAAAATLHVGAASEMLRFTFLPKGLSCEPVAFAFNSAVPPPGAAAAAFPLNQYVVFAGEDITFEAASTIAVEGPVVRDRAFIRGNVSNRAQHAIDIQDVIDLAAILFAGFDPGFDCEGASDVNDDGATDIADVVALIGAIFAVNGVVIPPPIGEAAVVTADGGAVPSVLGCAEGERCL